MVACRTRIFQSVFDYQQLAAVQVFEGESLLTAANHLVGRFVFFSAAFTQRLGQF